MAAWADGRITVTGTRRSRSHGHATLAVRIAKTHTCQSVASADDRDRRGLGPSRARWTVSAQKTAIAVHPHHRCVCSNTLWARVRTGEVAHTVTGQQQADEHEAESRV